MKKAFIALLCLISLAGHAQIYSKQPTTFNLSELLHRVDSLEKQLGAREQLINYMELQIYRIQCRLDSLEHLPYLKIESFDGLPKIWMTNRAGEYDIFIKSVFIKSPN